MKRYIKATTMKKFRVEFNTSGFYKGAGVWEVLDETVSVPAHDAKEAMEAVRDWYIDTLVQYDDYSYEDAEAEVDSYAWMAMEELGGLDEYGAPEYGSAVYWKDV